MYINNQINIKYIIICYYTNYLLDMYKIIDETI